MNGLDPAVKKETAYVAAWVAALSLVMEGVFLIAGQWNLSVLLGNLVGGAAAIGNYLLLGITVSRALATGEKDKIALRIRSSRVGRLLGMGAICALSIGLAKTNVYATVIPLLFPRIGLAFRPAVDRAMGKQPAAADETDLLD